MTSITKLKNNVLKLRGTIKLPAIHKRIFASILVLGDVSRLLFTNFMLTKLTYQELKVIIKNLMILFTTHLMLQAFVLIPLGP